MSRTVTSWKSAVLAWNSIGSSLSSIGLGVARGTVTTAHFQLVAEGYLVAKHGSGTSVAESVGAPGTPTPGPQGPPRHWAYDLRPGLPDLGALPRAAWLTASRAGLARLEDSALGYPDPAGLTALRAELTRYLGRVRAVASRSNQVVITHGAAEGLDDVDVQRRLAERGGTHPPCPATPATPPDHRSPDWCWVTPPSPRTGCAPRYA